MWELIEANRKKSIILFSVMFVIMLLLGFFIGFFFLPEDYWYYGILFAVVCWALMVGTTFLQGREIILRLAQAKPAKKAQLPVLFNVTKEMQIAANLPFFPNLYVVEENAPNAFATGQNPQNAAIVVTTGLLAVLNRDELQGVIAHEMAHIINRDVLFMTHAAVMLGSIVFLSNIYLRGLIFSGGGRAKRRSMNRATGILFLLSVFFSLLAPVVANILYFSISKQREYLADASAVRLSRYPYGLMKALQKISSSDYEFKSANSTLSSFYISDPYLYSRPLFQFHTHPPIEKRIKILQSLTHDVNYLTYQKVYSKIVSRPGRNTNIIPGAALRENATITVKKPQDESPPLYPELLLGMQIEKAGAGTETSTVGAGALSTILFGNAAAKTYRTDFIPPKVNETDKSAKAIKDENGKVYYFRQKNGWESFACVCGSAKHLSPNYNKKKLFCSACSTSIEIVKYQENNDLTTRDDEKQA